MGASLLTVAAMYLMPMGDRPINRKAAPPEVTSNRAVGRRSVRRTSGLLRGVVPVDGR
jgi:hypothetical protein